MPCGTKGLANPIFGLVGTTGGPQAVGWLGVGAGGRRQVERSLTCDLGPWVAYWHTRGSLALIQTLTVSLSNAFEIYVQYEMCNA